jgi:RNA polymerase sigma factor (sigma-70 family)
VNVVETTGGQSAAAVVVDPRVDFAELCRSVHPRLVGVLALRCGDRQLAEDIAQEALARTWRDWSKLRQRDSVEPWVFSTALNLLRSWHRRLLVARRKAPLLTVLGAVYDAAADLSVRDAVAALPVRQREAISLRFYADLSVRSTAEIMGCAEGTVRALTAQAVAALRATLGQEIDDDGLEVL